MFDAHLRSWVDGWLTSAGTRLAQTGISADALTIAGCGFGLSGAIAVAIGGPIVGLFLFGVGRLIDGLDGAVARAKLPTDRGGYLDIVLDFAVYAAFPLAFAVLDPVRNALASACLLAAIVLNAAAFLAFAAIAAKRVLSTSAQGQKSFYFMSGLAEGTETIAFYSAFCLWPGYYPHLAYAFASMCLLSAFGRIGGAIRLLR
jgi:phosphatidylglycerophosphate synthase